MIDVSVIIPVYNAGKHLAKCLQSVCAQSLRNIEIICVNDGSTDNSAQILNDFANVDLRIKVIEQNNAGAGAARNHGMRKAKGKYLSFLDADDFFEPDMLEKAFEKAVSDSADIVVFRADFYDDKKRVFFPCPYNLREKLLPEQKPFAGADVKKDVFKVVVGWAWDKLFRAEFIKENHISFQEQRTSNDLLFVFSAFVKAERISTVSNILAHQWRHAGKSLSVTREKSWNCFYNALLALRTQLVSWGLYERFEQDYINYALHFSLWNLNTLKNPTKKKLYYQLKSDWFFELGILGYPKEKFYNQSEYKQFETIMKYPYWPFFMNLSTFFHRCASWVYRALRS